jgi:hypothetical protein
MGRKIKYRFSGKTKDGKSVVAGCFTMYDSTGMPLPVMFTLISLQGWVPDIVYFYECAKNAGWKEKTIYSRLEEACLDGFNKKYWHEVKERLDFYIKFMSSSELQKENPKLYTRYKNKYD